MNCTKYGEEFLRGIESCFPYLFERSRFVATVCEDQRHGEFCLVILQSAGCKVKFYSERGTPEIFFGTLDAPSNWEFKSDVRTGWYTVAPIIVFLSIKFPDLAAPWPDRKVEPTTNEILLDYSARIRPFAEEVIAAFTANLDVMWWGDYQRWLESRIQERKNLVKQK